ncbi:MAG: hypothetical protein Q8R15_00865 [Candidatus Micrarchaeota archaeon]|nr:hypothetical protein [Candidatus Micrarchaeota archaeon]
MVSLDAPGLKMELTPEAAIGIVQKEVQRKGWKKMDLSDIITVYTPFYIFSFDVIAEGGAPPGKAALNANTGEINEFAPAILERPVKREKKTPEGMDVDVEPTNIKESEVEKVATVKIANMLGAKRENIVISAVSKIYIPFFRLWVDVAGDSFKFEIDGCLGYPTGGDAIPARQKDWAESTGDTMDKMKSPNGIGQLFTATLNEVPKLLGSGKGSGESKYVQWAIIGAVILVLGFFAYQQLGTKAECKVNSEFLSKPEFFGLFGNRNIFPQELEENVLYVQGTCSFSSRENDKLVIGDVSIKKKGIPIATTGINATTRSDSSVKRNFEMQWPRDEEQGNYELTFDKIIG